MNYLEIESVIGREILLCGLYLVAAVGRGAHRHVYG